LKDWVHAAIVTLLRVGVVLSVLFIVSGMVITFVGHPEYFASRPAVDFHFPNTLPEVVHGVRAGAGPAIVMAGLLILIATPVARVALSVIIFIIARDYLYVALTATVLVILIVSFVIGLVAA
jgi:uncharacterized membrane protein